MRGLRAAASRRCCRSWACSIRHRRQLLAEWPAGRPAHALRTRAHPQPRDRVHLPVFNLIGDLTVYENVELPLTYRGMKAAERKRRCKPRSSASACRTAPSISRPALRRSAAARRGGPRPGRRTAHPAGGRADRQPRFEERRGGHGPARELHRGGATICMVTHDPRYAAHADRSIHLFDGRIVEESVEAAV